MTESLDSPMNRKPLSILFASLAIAACAQAAAAATIDVAKTPWCGCCTEWVERMREAGYTVNVSDVEDTAPMARAGGVPDAARSCHTARVAGYTIEGHVPAADIERLLEEKPDAVGLAVPGMVAGSPGMETPGDATPGYQVMLIGKDGNLSVWATHPGSAEAHQHP